MRRPLLALLMALAPVAVVHAAPRPATKASSKASTKKPAKDSADERQGQVDEREQRVAHRTEGHHQQQEDAHHHRHAQPGDAA
ncbi:hypothetical protein, partial [Corallococcus sicarius]|uniref:hypothetical protein n=1 Tax=Corallococcus sicarius TaxID=2316726 RepID=UPI0011C47443